MLNTLGLGNISDEAINNFNSSDFDKDNFNGFNIGNTDDEDIAPIFYLIQATIIETTPKY